MNSMNSNRGAHSCIPSLGSRRLAGALLDLGQALADADRLLLDELLVDPGAKVHDADGSHAAFGGAHLASDDRSVRPAGQRTGGS